MIIFSVILGVFPHKTLFFGGRKKVNKRERKRERDSIVGKVLVLHTINPGLILGTQQGPLSTAGYTLRAY